MLYTTAKFAVVGLTEALRAELEPLGIGATVVCPGPVATDIIARTRRLQPREEVVGLAAGERDAAVTRSATMSNMLANGVPPDEVGRMVLAAVLENRLYVHTDRVMAGAIAARAEALLAAMPAAG